MDPFLLNMKSVELERDLKRLDELIAKQRGELLQLEQERERTWRALQLMRELESEASSSIASSMASTSSSSSSFTSTSTSSYSTFVRRDARVSSEFEPGDLGGVSGAACAVGTLGALGGTTRTITPSAPSPIDEIKPTSSKKRKVQLRQTQQQQNYSLSEEAVNVPISPPTSDQKKPKTQVATSHSSDFTSSSSSSFQSDNEITNCVWDNVRYLTRKKLIEVTGISNPTHDKYFKAFKSKMGEDIEPFVTVQISQLNKLREQNPNNEDISIANFAMSKSLQETDGLSQYFSKVIKLYTTEYCRFLQSKRSE